MALVTEAYKILGRKGINNYTLSTLGLKTRFPLAKMIDVDAGLGR